MKKLFIILLIFTFLNSSVLPGYAYVLIPEYLCELGLNYYNQGRISDALFELRKALVISPGYEPALRYINMIQEKPLVLPPVTVPPILKPPIEKPPIEKPPIEKPPIEKPPIEKPPILKPLPPVKTRPEAIKELLDKIERERVGLPPVIEVPKEIVPPGVLVLDEKIKTIPQPIEIEREKSIRILGKGITRFLVTQPNVLSVERISPDELLVTGKDFGHTYMHIWDQQGRWTLEFLTTPPKPIGLTLEEEMRRLEERAKNFKLRYSLNWSSYETGRRIYELERTSYSWNHWLSLTGETPYGILDSSLSLMRTLKEITDFTYFTLGLEQGRFGSFQDFSLRAFDYSPGVANLAFPGVGLRGAMLKSPAFNKKLDYTVFWGREGPSKYAGLSPGFAETRDSFLSGLDINFTPKEKQSYGFSVFHGWGSDRPGDLNPYGYDLDIDYSFDKWGLGYEIAYDSQTLAHLLNANFTLPKLKISSELRNTAKDFKTMTGWGWRAGELGLLSTLSYTPFEKLNITSRLDVFQDRLYPNPKDEDRLNQDFNWDAGYMIDPLTRLRVDYSLQNELGRLSPFRSHSMGLGIYRTLDWKKRINTYVTCRHRENKHFTTPSLNYINDKLLLGLRFSLIKDLYYFLSKEFNWTETRYTGEYSRPHALETGIDWYGQLFKSPFYGNIRLIYRDEEDTIAPLSFLSGEDYIEGYAELAYRPKPDIEAFFSTRVRNVWADNPNVTKRLEANFYAGLRYLWDTGLRWESIGTIEGYVFKDLNSDGLRQENEPLVEGIKLWLGKDKFSTTDEDGYYLFTKVKARKAYVNIDTTTIPSGFVLTVPATQEAAIAHGQVTRIDFGIVSRTEITGMVFEDIDGDGQWDPEDIGIKDVILVLEDGTKTATDGSGRYYFRKVSVGEHVLTLDINSLSVELLPRVPIKKEITLFEGVSYIHNIPVRRRQ